MILTFTLPSPPTANNLFFNIQGRGRSRTKEYNDWLEHRPSMTVESRLLTYTHDDLLADARVANS